MTGSAGFAVGGDAGRTVTVYGGCLDAGARVLSAAAEVGQLLAEQRVRIVYGGGTIGPAGVCARAAASAGGHVTAVTLERWLEPAEPAQEIVLAGTLPERTAELERRGQAYLVLPGGLGTMAEMFSVWAGRVADLHDRPIVVLDPDDAYISLWWAVAQRLDAGAVPIRAMDGLRMTRTATASAEMLRPAVLV